METLLIILTPCCLVGMLFCICLTAGTGTVVVEDRKPSLCREFDAIAAKAVTQVAVPRVTRDERPRDEFKRNGHVLAAGHALWTGSPGTALVYASSANLGRAMDLFSKDGNKGRAIASLFF
jgi:hypothetical protein